MVKEYYDQLMQAAAQESYMSIAINADGSPVNNGFIPWERTASAFNMRTPVLSLAVEDLEDKTIMEALGKCHLLGCYIYTELYDYSFLSQFKQLRDLFILKAEHMRDLTFLSDLKDLFLFYLQSATLPDLEPLVNACNQQSGLPGRCFGFAKCHIADTSALKQAKFRISELLIWPDEADEPSRWQTAGKPGLFRFYHPKQY